MNKSTKLEIGWAVFSIVVGLIYGIVSFLFADTSFQASVTHGLLIALLSTAVSFLIILINLYTDSRERLDAMREAGGRVDASVNRIEDGVKGTNDLLLDLCADKERLEGFRTNLLKRKELVREAGLRTLTNYLNEFRVTPTGFAVRGEQWALHAYTRLWEMMTRSQREIGENPDRCIIARVTHSNDIRLWTREEVHNSFYLLTLQKQFIEAGGIIVRIFVCPDETPNPSYVKVMDEMKEIGIDARYVWQRQIAQFPYDFLCLHDEGIVAKWYAGADGKTLGMCEIQDQIEDLVEERWNVLADLTHANYGDVQVIPKHRHIGINKARGIGKIQIPTIAPVLEQQV
jgi:hypothetical protein